MQIKTEYNTINIPFPQKKFNQYLNQLSLDSRHLDPKNVQNLLLVLTTDFLNGKLFLEEFSAICFRLDNQLLTKDPKFIHTKLSAILINGWELAYYARIPTSTRYNQMLNQLLKFCNLTPPTTNNAGDLKPLIEKVN